MEKLKKLYLYDFGIKFKIFLQLSYFHNYEYNTKGQCMEKKHF